MGSEDNVTICVNISTTLGTIVPDPGRDTNRPQSDKWQSQVPWSQCLQCFQQSKQVVVAGCCSYFNSVRPEINVWGRMREMWEMQQILIISLNDNLSFFLKKQTVAGGWENYRIIRPVLFISQQERQHCDCGVSLTLLMRRMTGRFLYSTCNLSHHHTLRYISMLCLANNRKYCWEQPAIATLSFISIFLWEG